MFCQNDVRLDTIRINFTNLKINSHDDLALGIALYSCQTYLCTYIRDTIAAVIMQPWDTFYDRERTENKIASLSPDPHYGIYIIIYTNMRNKHGECVNSFY